MLSFAYVALVNFFIIFNSENCKHFLFLEGENDTYGYLHINETRLELMEGGPYGREIYASNLSSLFAFNWFERSVNDTEMDLISSEGDYTRIRGAVNISFLCGFEGLYQSQYKEDNLLEKGNHNLQLLYILFVIPLLSPLLLKLQPKFRQLYTPAATRETPV